MTQNSKEKTNKSSLAAKVGGVVTVLGFVSLGISHINEIKQGVMDLLGNDNQKVTSPVAQQRQETCYSVEMNFKEKVLYSRINDPNVFEVHADNECPYPIMIRVEFRSLDPKKLEINPEGATDPESWPEYTIKAKQEDFRKWVKLPSLFFLTDEREFLVQIKWTIFKSLDMGGERLIKKHTEVIHIVDDESLSIEVEKAKGLTTSGDG